MWLMCNKPERRAAVGVTERENTVREMITEREREVGAQCTHTHIAEGERERIRGRGSKTGERDSWGNERGTWEREKKTHGIDTERGS